MPRGVDGGWINASGWCDVGIDAYLRDHHPRTRDQRTIISLGGFSAEEFTTPVDRVNAAAPAGGIAAVGFNVSGHDFDFDFSTIQQAAAAGVSALTAINTVKALRLDPRTGEPFLANRYGGLSGPAIKPIGLRVVSELREAGVILPIIGTGGVRTGSDCRKYLWAGADAVGLGSAV